MSVFKDHCAVIYYLEPIEKLVFQKHYNSVKCCVDVIALSRPSKVVCSQHHIIVMQESER